MLTGSSSVLCFSSQTINGFNTYSSAGNGEMSRQDDDTWIRFGKHPNLPKFWLEKPGTAKEHDKSSVGMIN